MKCRGGGGGGGTKLDKALANPTRSQPLDPPPRQELDACPNRKHEEANIFAFCKDDAGFDQVLNFKLLCCR